MPEIIAAPATTAPTAVSIFTVDKIEFVDGISRSSLICNSWRRQHYIEIKESQTELADFCFLEMRRP